MFFDNPFITYNLLPSKLGNIDICLMPNIPYLNVLFIVIDAIVNICQKQVFLHVPPFRLSKPQSSLFATSINKDRCYEKKLLVLNFSSFLLIVCKIIVVAIVACSIALDVECMPEDQVQTLAETNYQSLLH